MLQPVAAAGGLVNGIRHLPLHPAGDMQLLTALQGRPGMFNIAEELSQPIPDPMR